MSAARVRASVLILCMSALLAGCTTQLDSLNGATESVGRMWNSSAASQSRIVPIFSASTRKNDMISKAGSGEVDTHFSLNMVSVPPSHQAGLIERASFGKDDPKKHFVLASRSELDEDEFKNALAAHISGRVGRNRDVLLFVHGFNTSAEEARNRLAQIISDSHFGGVGVMFTWPSEGELLAYESDKERATASRDAVEQTIADLAAIPGVGRVHILAHSMGTWLAMEALRQRAIAIEVQDGIVRGLNPNFLATFADTLVFGRLESAIAQVTPELFVLSAASVGWLHKQTVMLALDLVERVTQSCQEVRISCDDCSI